MKEMLYFDVIVFSPTPSVLTCNCFEEFGRVLDPTAKGFNDERLKEDPLGPAVIEVVSDLRRFPHLDGSSDDVGSAVEDGILDRRDHADVEGYFAAIDPILDKDVGWPGERTRDETRHFFFWVKICALRLHEDFVPNSVVAASFHPMVVAAVKGVVS